MNRNDLISNIIDNIRGDSNPYKKYDVNWWEEVPHMKEKYNKLYSDMKNKGDKE